MLLRRWGFRLRLDCFITENKERYLCFWQSFQSNHRYIYKSCWGQGFVNNYTLYRSLSEEQLSWRGLGTIWIKDFLVHHAATMIGSSSVTASSKVCPVWGFLGMIVYSSLLQVSSAKSSACGTGIWQAVLRLSFRTLLSLFWLVSFGMLMRILLHGNSKFPCRVLFPPVPASGLTSYTGLSSPLRLMTMWIWSSQCERSFPGLPRSLRLRTRTLSPGRS